MTGPGMLVRNARLVPVGSPAPEHPVDLRIRDGRVAEVGALETGPGDEQVLDADGRWAIPGLWDAHVHFDQWVRTRIQVDLVGTGSAAEALHRLSTHLAEDTGSGAVVGFGYRAAQWPDEPSVRALDAVESDRPVVLISGDVHSGWLNTRALNALGAGATDGVIDENEWFSVSARLGDLPVDDVALEKALADTLEDAAARGVVGIVDLEFGDGFRRWPERVALGHDTLRVRPGVYPEMLDDVIDGRLRSGKPLETTGLVRMGPLKIISDGSLTTGTAFCCEAYPGTAPEHPRGKQNFTPEQVRELMHVATASGLRVAVHAIGDAAAADAVAAFGSTGATGSVEHAQLMRRGDLERMADLGVTASVQPSHLVDDRALTHERWADRADRCYEFRTMLDLGVPVAFGSDAPVSPLDPWSTMAAAVHRGSLDEEPWNPTQALTAAEALALSTDGHTTLAVGSPGDVVLIDQDPLGATTDAPSSDVARHLLRTNVEATIVDGRLVHDRVIDTG